MKIVRLKRGYKIRLNDSEYAALFELCTRGDGDMEGLSEWDWEQIGADVKRGLRTVTGRGSWALAEDRR
jgi:hypothetical protein